MNPNIEPTSITFTEASRFGKRIFRLKNGCLEISQPGSKASNYEVYYLSEISRDSVRMVKRHYKGIIPIVILCLFLSLFVSAFIFNPKFPERIIYTFGMGFLIVVAVLFPLLYIVSLKIEIVRFFDLSGKLAFEVIKEGRYAGEFENFISALQHDIEQANSAQPVPRQMEQSVTMSVAKAIPGEYEAETPELETTRLKRLTICIIDVTNEFAPGEYPTHGPYEATPELITDNMLSLPESRKILRLERNEDEWLEVGWTKRGFVLRENLNGRCYYSNSPMPDATEAAEFVAAYQTSSVCETTHWFRVNGGQATYDFVTNRFWFEVMHKRYPVTGTWSQSLYIGVHVVLVILLFFGQISSEMESGNENNPLVSAFGALKFLVIMAVFSGVLMIKFDFREPRKKGKHSYNSE